MEDQSQMETDTADLNNAKRLAIIRDIKSGGLESLYQQLPTLGMGPIPLDY